MIFILLLLFFICVMLKKERYSTPDPFIEGMKDRFISPLSRKYINQIDYYKDAPNIDLERSVGYGRDFRQTECHVPIDWSKLNDYEYTKAIMCLQGSDDRPRIKSINAI